MLQINSDFFWGFYPVKSKRGREEGDGTENVINCRDVCRKLSWHFMTTYDDYWRFMSMEQRDGNCHKMSQVVLHSALRNVCESTQATYQATRALIRSLALPGGVWQTVCCNAQVGLADSGCALSVCLPGCTHQGARDRAPQLGAGGPLSEGVGSALSDKELKSVVNDSVEDGLGPGGRSAKLLQYHRCHPSFQRLEVVAIPLSICPAFCHFFSEKFLADVEVNVDGVDLHVQP